MQVFFQALTIVLIANAILCLVRALLGPTLSDRMLAVNVVGTKTLVLLVLVAYAFDLTLFVDVAIVYGLLNYVVALAASRLIKASPAQRAQR